MPALKGPVCIRLALKLFAKNLDIFDACENNLE